MQKVVHYSIHQEDAVDVVISIEFISSYATKVQSTREWEIFYAYVDDLIAW